MGVPMAHELTHSPSDALIMWATKQPQLKLVPTVISFLRSEKAVNILPFKSNRRSATPTTNNLRFK